MKKYVSYLRVSTKKQGMGIEAQRQDVNSLVGSSNIVKEFSEKETGTGKRERPILNEAIDYCKDNGFDLVVAKIDRLTRNVEFLYKIFREMEQSNIKILFADMPNADKFVIGIMAMVAEWESQRNGERTKAALAHVPSYKKGKVMKDKNHEAYDRIKQKRLQAIKEKKENNPNNLRAKAMIELLSKNGYSNRQIAEQLNNNGYKTARGKKFTNVQVGRLMGSEEYAL